MGPCERGAQLEPIAIRQPDVGQDGIRREPLDGVDRRCCAVRLADNGVTAPLQKLTRDLPEYERVIDDEDASRQTRIVGGQAVPVKRRDRLRTYGERLPGPPSRAGGVSRYGSQRRI